MARPVQLSMAVDSPRHEEDQTTVNIREWPGRRKQKLIGVGTLCPFVCQLGPLLCLLITADSGIP